MKDKNLNCWIPSFAVALGLALSSAQAIAGSAIWLSAPSSGDWNTASNWTPGGPPNGEADTASFDVSVIATLSISANTRVNSIEFSPGASAYTVTSSPGFVFTISGAGIINNSGLIQNFVTAVDAGERVGFLTFTNSASAGSLTSLANTGATSTGGSGGITHFLDHSTAGNATIANHGGTVFAAQGGFTEFFDSSSAAQASFTNNGGAANGAFGGATLFLGTSSASQANLTNEGGLVSGAGGGFIQFSDRATAGQGVFNNNAGIVAGAGVGLIQFFGASTAGRGTFTNYGATGEGEPGSATLFTDSSTAANGIFSNRGGRNFLANGGATLFFGNSTAGNAIFISNGGEHGAAAGGETNFFDHSSAGTGTFTNRCGEVLFSSGGFTQFFNSSTAANAFFTNEGGVASGNNRGFGFMNFFDNSTAGHGIFVTNGGTVAGAIGGNLFFQDNSSAGNGTFTTNGGLAVGAGGGTTYFGYNASAANATFTTNGGMGLGAPGGETNFFGNATAAHGTFTVNGAVFGGASGGRMNFSTSSTAANGTFTINGGAAPGASGGLIKFWENSTAVEAVFVINGGTVPKIVTPASAGNGGTIQFIGNSVPGNSFFINDGGVVSGASGGLVTFASSGSLGNSTFINNGGAVNGAEGALFQFFGQDGGTATLIANSGTVGGAGGSIIFFEDADAPSARVKVFGNGSFDISPHNLPGVRIGSIEGSGVVFLGANNLSVGGNDLNTLFSGVIRDGGLRGGTGGSLTKIGPGTLTLSGSNTYSGDTNIVDGSLIVNGSIASFNSFVSPVSLLGGNGSLGGNIVSSGIVSPGDSGPGRLRANGSYTQNSDGTLQIEIGGLVLVQHDLLQVNGTGQLNGTLRLARLNNFHFLPGDKVTFLTAGGGVAGAFSTVANSFNDTIVLTKVVYEANQVSLEASQGSFTSLSGLTRNQRAVASNLDLIVTDPRESELIAFLDTELLGKLPHDYDLIAPEELASIYEIGFSQATIQNLNLQRRLEEIRAGSTGFSASGFNVRGDGRDNSDGKTSIYSASSEKPAPIFNPSPDNRWGMFVTGSGEFVNTGNEDANAHGYDITTGGVTLGLDFRPAPDFALGVNAGYAHSSADLVNKGRVTVEGAKIGAYATYFSGGFYLDSAVGAGWNSYDTRRATLKGDTRGTTDGAEFNALIGTGYDWKKSNWSFGPTATFQYSNVGINAFTEGRSLGSLEIQEQNEDLFRSTLGVKASYDWKTCGVIVRPDMRVGWQHEYGDQSYPIDARFASGAGNVFTVRGPAVSRDKAVFGVGLAVQWSSRVLTDLYYQGEAGSNYTAHSVGGGVSVNF
jgi:autotransporter-associated beta strand protein